MNTKKQFPIKELLFTIAIVIYSCKSPEVRQEKIVFENDFELPDTSQREAKHGEEKQNKSDPISTIKSLDQQSLESFFPNWNNLNLIEENERAFSGKYLCKLDSQNEYSVTFTKKLADLKLGKPDFVDTRWMVKQLGDSRQLTLVLSVEKQDSILQYESMNVNPAIRSKGIWQEIETSFPIKSFDENSVVKCYLWNQGRGNWQTDDFTLEFIYEHK